jgi:gas vesicle protein
MIVAVCISLVIVFCVISISGRIFAIAELPVEFMAAFLGAIVTAIITLLLLNGQSTADEVKEKNVKVFEKKSKLFEEFINKLVSIMSNQNITVNDLISIIESEYYSKSMLYLKEDAQDKIKKSLTNLSTSITAFNDDNISNLKEVNESYDKIRESITEIINILTEEIGLGGKINIDSQKDLDRAVFPTLFQNALLEEVNKIFLNEGIFNNAFYKTMANGKFLVLNLNGKFAIGSGIHIGPFFNETANDDFPPYKGINFRFFLPPNPLSGKYGVKDGPHNYYKFLTDFQDSENGLINLQKPLEPYVFELMPIDSKIYNKELQEIRFDETETLILNYSGIFRRIAKAIAVRTFFYYSNAKTKQDGLTIKKLFERFESIPEDQFIKYMINVLSTPDDFSK